MYKQPTRQELLEEELECVDRHADNSWRHGCYMTNVYYRKSDNTYWEVMFQLSTDGEYNGISENDYDIRQVEKKQKMIIVYE